MKNNKFQILCVDDDTDILNQFKVVLEANGYLFLGALSADEGLKVYKEKKPDLLIVDLMMEKVDSGMSLLKDLKAEGCKAPIYMFSAVGQQLSYNMDISNLNIAGVFQKPIEFKELLNTLKNKLKA
jgi:Response regulator containing CheY-like receiver, AAA-type ATPase, and DNA-binding domains